MSFLGTSSMQFSVQSIRERGQLTAKGWGVWTVDTESQQAQPAHKDSAISL